MLHARTTQEACIKHQKSVRGSLKLMRFSFVALERNEVPQSLSSQLLRRVGRGAGMYDEVTASDRGERAAPFMVAGRGPTGA